MTMLSRATKSISDVYEKLEKVGEGTYGVVWKARERSSGKIVAIKKIRLETADEGAPATAIREISLLQELRRINNEHIVKLFNIVHYDEKVYLIFEYLDMDLHRYISRNGRGNSIPQALIKSYMHQLMTGLECCHRHRILHRDLKPGNLLIDNNGKLSIADFGLARRFELPSMTYTHEVVTLWYRAPEVLLGARHYSTALDMWSVGCIFAEMCNMMPLFRGEVDSQIGQLFSIFRIMGTPTEATWPGVSKLPDYNVGFPSWTKMRLSEVVKGLPPDGIDLLEKLLTYDPAKRISARKALQHPYLLNALKRE